MNLMFAANKKMLPRYIMAAELGMAPSALSEVISGIRNLEDAKMEQVAKYFGLTVQQAFPQEYEEERAG
jgi:transcriptional regulator with XRE-family HTH domain